MTFTGGSSLNSHPEFYPISHVHPTSDDEEPKQGEGTGSESSALPDPPLAPAGLPHRTLWWDFQGGRTEDPLHFCTYPAKGTRLHGGSKGPQLCSSSVHLASTFVKGQQTHKDTGHWAPQKTNPFNNAATTEARVPRAHAPQQEKPPQ